MKRTLLGGHRVRRGDRHDGRTDGDRCGQYVARYSLGSEDRRPPAVDRPASARSPQVVTPASFFHQGFDVVLAAGLQMNRREMFSWFGRFMEKLTHMRGGAHWGSKAMRTLLSGCSSVLRKSAP